MNIGRNSRFFISIHRTVRHMTSCFLCHSTGFSQIDQIFLRGGRPGERKTSGYNIAAEDMATLVPAVTNDLGAKLLQKQCTEVNRGWSLSDSNQVIRTSRVLLAVWCQQWFQFSFEAVVVVVVVCRWTSKRFHGHGMAVMVEDCHTANPLISTTATTTVSMRNRMHINFQDRLQLCWSLVHCLPDEE
ncbi:hypothetical protein V6N11_082463 [Hibiscus sabdariffa]|uniref:Uncharacterized protein n=1 Tax=Hibiscus sabdariffa TaxID=183260 RepID=A0ABR2PCP8_9ROSI